MNMRSPLPFTWLGEHEGASARARGPGKHAVASAQAPRLGEHEGTAESPRSQPCATRKARAAMRPGNEVPAQRQSWPFEKLRYPGSSAHG